MKKIFITGANGFIGGHLSNRLTADGHRVTSYTGNILDEKQIGLELQAEIFDYVIHLAGISSISQAEGDLKKLHEVNVLGTYALIEKVSLLSQKPHFIFASTAQVYNAAGIGSPFSEEQAPYPTNAYARSKLAGEAVVSEFSKTFGFAASIFRIFNHTHMSQSPEFFLPRIYQSCLEAKKMGQSRKELYVGSVQALRDISPVQNILDVLSNYLNAEHGPGHLRVFNISSGVGFKLSDMAQALGRAMGIDLVLVEDPAKFRPNDPQVFIGQNQNIEQYLRTTHQRADLDSLISQFLTEI